MAIMKYKTQLKLYNSYFDYNDRLSTKSILNIFQDVASYHAEEIDVGYEKMLERNLYWVLSRIKLDVVKMPVLNQDVIVETWPREKGKIDFDRELKITDLNGETLVLGISKWCVIDTVKRSLQRTDSVNYNGECYKEKNYPEKFVKIELPKAEFQKKFSHIVSFSDLDHNKHMNNTNYANLVVSAVENKKYNHFEINFINECLLGEKVTVSTYKNAEEEYVLGKVEDKIVFTTFVK